MTLRIVGALLIIAGCGCVGFKMAASYRREMESLIILIDLLNTFECELQYRSPPISVILCDFAEGNKGQVYDFCRCVTRELETQARPNVEACMNAALSKSEGLPKETRCLFQKIGTSLGKFDIEGQLLEIRSIRNEAQQKLDFLRNNQTVQMRNYKTLGLCTGAAIAILLI